MASSAPAASIGLTIAPLAAATAYGSSAVILLTAVPMLVIANAYRKLNLWNANTGASFEWVGRAISPYLGFHYRLSDYRRVRDRHGQRRGSPRPVRPRRIRREFNELVGGHFHRYRSRRHHAGHSDCGHQDHRPDPARHGSHRVRGAARLEYCGPGP